MARTTLSDYFQVYPFWLMDVAPIEPHALPIFTPLFGFSSISAPELTLETQEITEGNWPFRRKVINRGDAGSITLMRAAKWYDSDFYKWVMAALFGDTGGRGQNRNVLAIGGATPRRTLLLVQFLSRQPLPPGYAEAAAAAGLLAVQGAATQLNSSLGLFSAAATQVAAQTAGAFGASLGPVEFAPRLPAKAWLLYDCVPTRYKPGGDFDATSSDISIQELEVAVEAWDEVSLGSEIAPIAIAIDAAVSNTSGGEE